MKKMIPILIAALLLVALIPTVAHADEAKPANSDAQVPEIPTILIAPIPKIKIGEIEVPRDAKAGQEAAERIQKLLSGEEPLKGSGETPNVPLHTIVPIPTIGIDELNATDINRQPAA